MRAFDEDRRSSSGPQPPAGGQSSLLGHGAGHSMKHEPVPSGPGSFGYPGGAAGVISMDAPLPDGPVAARYFRHSEGGPSGGEGGGFRGGGPRRGRGRAGSWNTRGGRQSGPAGMSGPSGRPVNPKVDLRHKFVKMGDRPDRVLFSVKAAARALDAFVAMDGKMWDLPPLEAAVSGDESAAANNDSDLLARTLLTRLELEAKTNSEFAVELMADCIQHLAHKHSFYASMWWLLIQECIPEEATLAQVLREAYGMEPVKGEAGITIKGELVEVGDGEAVVIGEQHIDPLSGAPIKKSTKLEQIGEAADPTVAALAASAREVTKQDVYIIYLFIVLLDRLTRDVTRLLHSPGGLHEAHRITCTLRFLADCVNLCLVNPIDLISRAGTWVEQACGVYSQSASSLSDKCHADFLATLGLQTLLWLNRDIFNQHQDHFRAVRDYALQLTELRSRTSRALTKALHPVINWNSWHRWGLSDDDAVDSLACLIEAYTCNLDRQWVAKVIPRLYDSPNLREARHRTMYIRLHIDVKSMELPAAMWAVFCRDVRGGPGRSGEKIADAEEFQPYQLPESRIRWRIPVTPGIPIKIYTEEFLRTQMDVAPMNAADQWITRKYIEDVVSSLFLEPDQCAETLLMLPVRHPQFELVLVEHLIGTCLAPCHGAVGSVARTRCSAALLAQLLHKICVLQKSIRTLVVRAVQELLQHAASWDDIFFEQMVTFLSLWMVAENSYSDAICEMLLATRLFGIAAGGKTETGEMKDDEKLEVKPDPSSPAALRIGYATSEVSVLRDEKIRFIAHLMLKVRDTSFEDSWIQRVPPQLRNLVPPLKHFDDLCHFAFSVNESSRDVEDTRKMRRLRMTDPAPLEAVLLSRILRLQVSGPVETRSVIREVIGFLQSCNGKGFIKRLAHLDQTDIDGLLFPASLALKSLKVKTMADGEEPVAKRLRLDRGDGSMATETAPAKSDVSVPVVKAEVVDVPGDTDEVWAAAGGVAAAGSAQQKATSAGIDRDDNSSSAVKLEQEVPDERPLVLAAMEFERLEDTATFRWDGESLTRLLTNSLLCLGSKTLSHSHRVIDLYAELFRRWRLVVATLSTPTAIEGENFMAASVAVDVDRIIIQACMDGFVNCSVNRFKFLLYQLMSNSVINPLKVLDWMVTSEQKHGSAFATTVAGDLCFADVIECALNVTHRNVKLSKREPWVANAESEVNAATAETTSQVDKLLATVFIGCGALCNAALDRAGQPEAQQSLQSRVFIKRLLRYGRDSWFWGYGQTSLTWVSDLQQRFTSLAASGHLGYLEEAARVYGECFGVLNVDRY